MDVLMNQGEQTQAGQPALAPSNKARAAVQARFAASPKAARRLRPLSM